MAQDALVHKYLGKPVDWDSGEPINDTDGLFVEIYQNASLDVLLTEGGTIPKTHERIPKLKEQGVVLRDHPEDKTLYVVDPAGRPMYLDKPYIRIQIPGDKDHIIDRPVTEADKRRFPQHWKRFESTGGNDGGGSGTPLSQWPHATKAVVNELGYWGIKTVEQLAAVSDGNVSNVGPYLKLRQQARDWLEAAKGAAPVEAMRAELSQRDGEIEVLKRALKEQGDKIAELSKQHRK